MMLVLKFNPKILKKRRNNSPCTRTQRNSQERRVREEKERRRLVAKLPRKSRKLTILSTALVSNQLHSAKQPGQPILKTTWRMLLSTLRKPSQIDSKHSRLVPRKWPPSSWPTSINSPSTHQRVATEVQLSPCHMRRRREMPQPSSSSKMDSERSKFDFHIASLIVQFIFSVVGIIWQNKQLITIWQSPSSMRKTSTRSIRWGSS